MSDGHGGALEAEPETQDPKAADTGSDDEEEEEDAGGVSDGQQEGSGGESKDGGGEAANGTGKKKKKKQKKRKKKGAGGGSSDGSSSGSASPSASPPTSPSANPAPAAPFPPSSTADAPLCQPDLDDMLPVEVAEKRFAAALESMRSKADLCMWVQLARCRVGDKKLRRLTDALIHCETVTSVDLSENLISDAGLRQLACALSAPSAAPDLISLNVKRNPISAAGRACLANLQAVRKLVRIEYEESPPPAAQEKKGAQGAKGQGMADARGFESGERMGGALASKASNPQIRIDAAVRFIREASEKLQQVAPAGSSRRSIATRVFDSGMMTEALEDVVELVDADLRRNPTKSYHNSPINKLPLPLRLVVESLPTFVSLLELPIPPQQCQRKLAEPAAGRHRILAVQLLRKVLGACGRVVDDRLAREDVGRKVAALLFDFPWSNVLHHGVCCFLMSALERSGEKVESEEQGKKEGKGAEEKALGEDKGEGKVEKQGEREGDSKGEGEGEKQAAAAVAAAEAAVPAGPMALPVRLAVTAAPWVNTPIGQRPGHAGPIIQLMFDIRGRATTSAPLQAKLEKLPEWQAFAQPGGKLDELLSQQHGTLCGPKPVVPGSDAPDMGAGSGGQSMLFGEPDLPPSVLGKLRAIYLQ
ncbi:unnamed protein product [Closterium sp. Yama58-4]|nr:unnamed protein product [Closterium sp. Yama58-4]